MKVNLISLSVFMALGLAACAPAEQSAEQSSAQAIKAPADAATLNQMYTQLWEESLEMNPLRATFVGDPRYNDRLPNFFTEQSRAEQMAFTRRWLSKFEALDPAGLENADRISYDMIVRDLRQSIEGDVYPDWQQPLNQFRNMAGMFAQLGSGTGAQPFKTVTDYENWLKRAANIPEIMQSMQENMRIGMAARVVQPKPLMEKVIPQFDALIKEKAEETIFWQPIANLPADISEDDKKRLSDSYRTLIKDQIMPAYAEMRRFVAEEYLPVCRDSHGLAALPGGEAWYAFRAKSSTTTDMSPAQIHDIGLAEVARIHEEMRGVMKQVGFSGSLQDFFVFMTTDKQFEFSSEEALLTDYRSLEDKINARVGELFSLLPKAAFEIRPVESFRAASSAGGSYQRPSEDGSRPGIFYVNTYDLPSRKTWDRDALFLHEAIPGHHFQLALQQELSDLPMFRRFGGETAFSEGWGLYAESLGEDLGAYADPYQYFGRLQAELWRAIRLVVDTGLHSKGWTREQVIAYMKENSATTDTEATSETERYMAIPGQALAYKIGELKIQELRQRAQKQMDDRFDIREFHAEVLRDGSIPLDVLEAKIERWMAK